jgi:hypothetical protein
MVRLIAILTMTLVLSHFENFLKKAEIEVPSSLTERDLFRTVTNENTMATRVFGRYYMDFFRGEVRYFLDRDEDIYGMISRLDDREMSELCKKNSLIDEAEAQQIACEIFNRLGFSENDFESVQVHQFTYQPDEMGGKVFKLPFFHIQWDLKGAHKGDPLDPHVKMVISGTTKHLVLYDISGLPKVGP